MEIQLKDTEGITQGETTVSGVVVTFEDGSKIGLRHVVEIWRAIELGGDAAVFADKKITNVRYITQDNVIDFPMEIAVKKFNTAEVSGEFTDAKTIRVTGLPEEIENPKATVQTQVGRGQKATVVGQDVEVKDGVIALENDVDYGWTYAITISSDNYLPIKPTADLPFNDIDLTSEEDWRVPGVNFAVKNNMMRGVGGGKFAPDTNLSRGMIVTILYRLEGEPEAADAGFQDVAADAWYAKAVGWAKANKVVMGVSDTAFDPNADITREQMATMLSRYAAFKGADVSAKADLSGFEDASTISSWATDSVSWAVSTGLMQGMSAKTIGPQGKTTRAQAATLMQRISENILSKIPAQQTQQGQGQQVQH